MNPYRGYYFITDSALSRAGTLHDVRCAVKAGVRIVQYREKCASTKKMYEEASALKKVCKNAFFLVNDRVDIALSVGADGVHLGQGDLPYKIARKLLGKKKIIGLTAHTLKEALEAQELGADYIGVSPIFSTATKPDAGPATGPALVTQIKKRVSLPLIAIGGITLQNALGVIAAGADGLCAISAVLTSPDVRRQIEHFQALFKKSS